MADVDEAHREPDTTPRDDESSRGRAAQRISRKAKAAATAPDLDTRAADVRRDRRASAPVHRAPRRIPSRPAVASALGSINVGTHFLAVVAVAVLLWAVPAKIAQLRTPAAPAPQPHVSEHLLQPVSAPPEPLRIGDIEYTTTYLESIGLTASQLAAQLRVEGMKQASRYAEMEAQAAIQRRQKELEAEAAASADATPEQPAQADASFPEEPPAPYGRKSAHGEWSFRQAEIQRRIVEQARAAGALPADWLAADAAPAADADAPPAALHTAGPAGIVRASLRDGIIQQARNEGGLPTDTDALYNEPLEDQPPAPYGRPSNPDATPSEPEPELPADAQCGHSAPVHWTQAHSEIQARIIEAARAAGALPADFPTAEQRAAIDAAAAAGGAEEEHRKQQQEQPPQAAGSAPTLWELRAAARHRIVEKARAEGALPTDFPIADLDTEAAETEPHAHHHHAHAHAHAQTAYTVENMAERLAARPGSYHIQANGEVLFGKPVYFTASDDGSKAFQYDCERDAQEAAQAAAGAQQTTTTTTATATTDAAACEQDGGADVDLVQQQQEQEQAGLKDQSLMWEVIPDLNPPADLPADWKPDFSDREMLESGIMDCDLSHDDHGHGHEEEADYDTTPRKLVVPPSEYIIPLHSEIPDAVELPLEVVADLQAGGSPLRVPLPSSYADLTAQYEAEAGSETNPGHTAEEAEAQLLAEAAPEIVTEDSWLDYGELLVDTPPTAPTTSTWLHDAALCSSVVVLVYYLARILIAGTSATATTATAATAAAVAADATAAAEAEPGTSAVAATSATAVAAAPAGASLAARAAQVLTPRDRGYSPTVTDLESPRDSPRQGGADSPRPRQFIKGEPARGATAGKQQQQRGGGGGRSQGSRSSGRQLRPQHLNMDIHREITAPVDEADVDSRDSPRREAKDSPRRADSPLHAKAAAAAGRSAGGNGGGGADGQASVKRRLQGLLGPEQQI